MSAIYNRLEYEPDFCPNPSLNNSRGLWHIFGHVPWYAHPRITLNYLQELLAANIPCKTHSVPIENTSENAGSYITRHIDKEKVANMVRYAKAYNATINDVLLAAIFRALSKTGEWDTGAALRMAMTIDLRRYLPERKAESVANFSSIELFTYGTVMEDSFESTLTRVAEMVRKRKSSWLGLSPFSSAFMGIWALPFSILNRITKKGWESKSHTSNAFDLFTNMGDIPLENVNMGGSPTRAWLLPPGCSLPILFFGCSGYDGTLSLSASVVPDATDTVEKFFDLMISELPLTAVMTMSKNISELEAFILSCFDSEHDSAKLLRSLETLELLITPNSVIDKALLIGEAYEFIPTVYNAEKAYFYYQLYYSQNGYSVGWYDENRSPPHYCGRTGDFRNEATVSYLIVKLGFEKCQKIDSDVREWLEKNGLKYDLFHNENGYEETKR